MSPAIFKCFSGLTYGKHREIDHLKGQECKEHLLHVFCRYQVHQTAQISKVDALASHIERGMVI